MINLKKFNTHDEYDAYIVGEPILPNISICNDQPSHVHYNKIKEIQPNNEIWYTTTDGSVLNIEPYAEFGANVISNTYVDGKGIIKCDGPITIIGEESLTTSVNKLTSISLPNSIITIEDYNFTYTPAITQITIGKNVTKLGDNVFGYCPSLISVTCLATVPPEDIYYSALSNIGDGIIYVPAESVEAYKSVSSPFSCWSKHADRIQAIV